MEETIPTLNREMHTRRAILLANVRAIDIARSALIDQLEYADNVTEARAMTDKIVRLGKEADRLENKAHELYLRMWKKDGGSDELGTRNTISGGDPLEIDAPASTSQDDVEEDPF